MQQQGLHLWMLLLHLHQPASSNPLVMHLPVAKQLQLGKGSKISSRKVLVRMALGMAMHRLSSRRV
jgi:hypothetical protein